MRGSARVCPEYLLPVSLGLLVQAHTAQLQLGGVWLHAQPAAYRQQVFWADTRSDVHDALTARDYLRQVQRRYPAFDEARLNRAI